MLQSAHKLKGFGIAATDGHIGHIKDVYFDDQKWTIRYFVVDTGGWLSGRKVLISPVSFHDPDWKGKMIRVDLTRQQIEDSPGIDTDQPVSRRQEAELFRHYDYPFYWTGPLLWGYGAFPPLGGTLGASETDRERTAGDADPATEAEHADSHLCSSNEVIGYTIRATDDAVGHVEDFLFDDEDWSIRFMLVDTRNWWPGKHVLVSPQLVKSVSWGDSNVFVDISREAVESSLEFDWSNPPSRDTATSLYRDSGRPPEMR